MKVQVNVPQLQQALMTNAQLQNQMAGAQQLQQGNGYAGGLGILGAALGGFMQGRKAKELAANELDINQQIAAFQEQKAQELAMAEQARAEQEYKRKLAEKEQERAFEMRKMMAGKQFDVDNRQPEQTAQMQNLASMGLKPGTPEYNKAMQGILNKSTAPVVNVNNGEKLSAMQDALGKKNADKYIDWENQAYAANETLAGLSKLKQISQLQNTGKVEEAKALVGQLFGTEAGANMQAFGSVASSLVLQQAEKLKGAMSDGDIKLLEATMPQFGNDPRANQVVFDVLENAAQRAIKRFNDADAYFQENGKLQGYKPEFQFARNSQQQSQETQKPQATKSLGGVEYVQINGQWYQK